MTPATAPEVVVEYHVRCFCGAFIVTAGKTVTCAHCGLILGIRRAKRRRQHWIEVARRRNGVKGWRWRKNVVESVVERRFQLQCGCGTSVVTSEKATTCTACGEEIGVRRVGKRAQPEIIVRYEFDCCFCGAPMVATRKTATCAHCGKALEIARVGTHRQYWKATPSLTGQDTSEQGNTGEPVHMMLSLLLALFLYCAVCLGQYVYDWVSG
jgi:hypothetical protein